jgi:AcrR family transcriptional regulator
VGVASRPVVSLDPAPAGQEPDSPRGGRPRDETRDEAILEAAVALIAEAGYDSMSMEAIAARAGVSKATIYRRWPGKAELVAEAIRHLDPGGHADPDDTGSLRGDLLALVATLFSNVSGVDGAELGRLLAGHKQQYRERVTSTIVSRAQARGELPNDMDPPPAVMDTALGMALFRVMSGEALDDAYAELLVDRILIPSLRS